MSLSLENATGLTYVVGTGATLGAALTGLSGAATTYSSAAFNYAIGNVPNTFAVKSGQATPTTDGNTGAAMTLAINQSRVFVWAVANGATTPTVFAGPVVSWPNASGTALGAPIPLQFPAVPATYAVFAAHAVSIGSNGSAFTFGSTNWNTTGVTVGTVTNCAGGMPAAPLATP